MKWAKLKALRDQRTLEQREHDEKCFRYYSKDELKAEFGNKNIWKRHPFRFRFKSEEDYLKFQDRYEVFVGGYLYFYDERNRSGVIDSILYFKWSPYDKSGSDYSVTIYLSPAPLTKKFKGKSITRLSSSNGNIALTATEAGTGKGSTQTVALKKAVGDTVMALDGETEGAIDPPPPPAPPPPRMQD